MDHSEFARSNVDTAVPDMTAVVQVYSRHGKRGLRTCPVNLHRGQHNQRTVELEVEAQHRSSRKSTRSEGTLVFAGIRLVQEQKDNVDRNANLVFESVNSS